MAVSIDKTNTVRTEVDELRVVTVEIDPAAAQAHQAEHPEDIDGAANAAFYAVQHAGVAVLAADYEAGPNAIDLLVAADDTEAVREALDGDPRWSATVKPAADVFEDGLQRFGDGNTGVIDVWRHGRDVLLVERTQSFS